MSQNRSPAVMAQRHEPHDSLDDFPTPPWATRALIEHVLIGGGWRREQLAEMTCREPAANRGYMVKPLAEYFASVDASDVHDYGAGYPVRDFLFPGKLKRVDWTITNPPFRLAAEFILRALETSKVGVAVLVRSSFIEGIDRYQTLFSRCRPTFMAQFSERVPMFKGKLDPKGSAATAYCWLVWSRLPHQAMRTEVRWIPPCRRTLERPDDYRSAA